MPSRRLQSDFSYSAAISQPGDCGRSSRAGAASTSTTLSIAVVLRTSPTSLLMPGIDQVGPATGWRSPNTGPAPEANDVWHWLTAERFIDPAVGYLEFGSRSWPRWVLAEVEKMVGRTPEEQLAGDPQGRRRGSRDVLMATIEKYETKRRLTRYRVRYRTPDRRQADKRGFKTKRDAEAFAATVEVTKLRGEYVAPALGKATIDDLGEAWSGRQKGVMKPSAFHSVESAWRVHVQPRWGPKPSPRSSTPLSRVGSQSWPVGARNARRDGLFGAGEDSRRRGAGSADRGQPGTRGGGCPPGRSGRTST